MFDSLSGITFGKWMRLLSENSFSISKSNWSKALLITITSMRVSSRANKEKKQFADTISHTELTADPIFIIGHWRSGTTFLHNILSKDTRFAYPTLIDIKHPNTILINAELFQKMAEQSQDQKRAMDNIRVNLLSPQEEEFAIAIMTLRSSLLNWMFPKNTTYIDKYLSFRNISSTEIEEWKKTYLYYLKKLTLKYNKQLLLKSPSNTAKIRILLELFPNAKFIHIHRNPYDVFASTKKLYLTAIKNSNLQYCAYDDLNHLIIRQYKELYDAFWQDVDRIPKGNFHEIAFEQLEDSPLETIKTIYNTLHIGDFKQAEPSVKNYLDETMNYKKNKHAQMDEELRKEVQLAWAESFEKWNYTK